MITMQTLSSREEWLERRSGKIGGSDAASIVGVSPWKSNVRLYREKIGEADPGDISDSPAVVYGVKAEPLLRDLFILDHPRMTVNYEEWNSWENTRFPWALASLDGWLIDDRNRNGILEIKTATIRASAQWKEWDGRIPDHYYVQVIHYMMVMEADFAVLRACIRKEGAEGFTGADIRDYWIERAECLEDIQILETEEELFYRQIQNREEPALRLPNV